MIAAVMRKFFVDQCVTFLAHRVDALLIAVFQRHNLFGRQTLGTNFLIAPGIAVKAQVQLRIETVIIFCSFTAEIGNGLLFMKIGLNRHRL